MQVYFLVFIYSEVHVDKLRDLFWLLCTRRKLFITSLICNNFSCGGVHIPCLCNQQTNIKVICVNML